MSELGHDVVGSNIPNLGDIISSELEETNPKDMSSQDKSKVFSVQGKQHSYKSQKSEKTNNIAKSLKKLLPFFKTDKDPKKMEVEVKDQDKYITFFI